MRIFTNDIDTLDESLPRFMLDAWQHSFLIVGAVILALVANFWVIIAVVPLSITFVIVNRYYLKTFRELSWLEEINSRSVLNHFRETLQGLVTIRAAEKERDFTTLLYRYVFYIGLGEGWLLFYDLALRLARKIKGVGVGPFM